MFLAQIDPISSRSLRSEIKEKAGNSSKKIKKHDYGI